KMTKHELLKLAGGHIWTGRQAKENGLIDELGTLEDAVAAAAKMGGLPSGKAPELLELPKTRGFLESLLEGGADSRLHARLRPLLREAPGLADTLRQAEGLLLLRREPVWAVLPYSVRLK